MPVKLPPGSITHVTPAPKGLEATAYCDGSCPANPGPMGIGYTFVAASPDPTDTPLEVQVGTRLGDGTNNRAEYLALIFLLRHALRAGVTHITVYSDSLLTVNQVNGKFQCKDKSLLHHLEEAAGLKALFASFTLRYIHREENPTADHLSKNPTCTDGTARDIEINLRGQRQRKLPRWQAAMIRWWWKTGRCRNEYRLSRIFGLCESSCGKIGKGESYQDLTVRDLPGNSPAGITIPMDLPEATLRPRSLAKPRRRNKRRWLCECGRRINLGEACDNCNVFQPGAPHETTPPAPVPDLAVVRDDAQLGTAEPVCETPGTDR